MKLNNMINCVITSPKQTIVYKNILSVSLPARSGKMQVLPGHVESFILLNKGDIVLKKADGLVGGGVFSRGKQSEIVRIASGECHIKNNKVTIIL